jgi:hypothetical protein
LRYRSTPPNTTRTSGFGSLGQFSDSRDNNDNESLQKNYDAAMETISPLAFSTTAEEDLTAEYYSREEHTLPSNELETVIRTSLGIEVVNNKLFLNNNNKMEEPIMEEPILKEPIVEEPMLNTTSIEQNSQELATASMEEPIIYTTTVEQNSQELATTTMVDESKISTGCDGLIVDVHNDENKTKRLNNTTSIEQNSELATASIEQNSQELATASMEEPIIYTATVEQNSQELATTMMVDESKISTGCDGFFVDVHYDENKTKRLNGTIEHIVKR